jgi:hypothetical protein
MAQAHFAPFGQGMGLRIMEVSLPAAGGRWRRAS